MKKHRFERIFMYSRGSLRDSEFLVFFILVHEMKLQNKPPIHVFHFITIVDTGFWWELLCCMGALDIHPPWGSLFASKKFRPPLFLLKKSPQNFHEKDSPLNFPSNNPPMEGALFIWRGVQESWDVIGILKIFRNAIKGRVIEILHEK